MFLRNLVFFIFLFVFCCETKKPDRSDVLARVDGETLTLNKAQHLNGDMVLQKENISKLVSGWITNTVLLNRAKALGLEKDSVLIKKRDVFFNELVVSSFIKGGFNPNITISKKEVLNYYKNNKSSFFRENEEVFLEHYFTEEIRLSKKINSFFTLNKKKDINISDFLIEVKAVKKGRSSGFFEPYLFNTNKKEVGPIRSKKGYHFFKILNRYKKGSLKGLEQVYDEIHQKLYKQKEMQLSFVFLDSIKNSLEIYINPKYQ